MDFEFSINTLRIGLRSAIVWFISLLTTENWSNKTSLRFEDSFPGLPWHSICPRNRDHWTFEIVRDLLRSSFWSSPPVQAGSPNYSTLPQQGLWQSGFEYLEGWRLCNLSRQPGLYSSCDFGFFIEMEIHVSSCAHCLFLCLWAPLTVDYQSSTISSHYAKIAVCLTGNVFPIATPIAMNWLKKDRQQDQFSWWSVFPADIWWTRHCRKIYKSKAGNLSS